MDNCHKSSSTTTQIIPLSTVLNGTKHKDKLNISRTDVGELNQICPGAAQYLSLQAHPQVFRVNVSDCRRPARDARAKQGVVYGVCGDSTFCQLLVQVPQGTVVHAHFIYPVPRCMGSHRNVHIYTDMYDERPNWKADCRNYVLTSTANQMLLVYYNRPPVRVTFHALKHTFEKVDTSDHSGFLAASLETQVYLTAGEVCGTLKVPSGHVVLVSIEHRLVFSREEMFLSPSAHHKVYIKFKQLFFDNFDKRVMIFITQELRVCLPFKPIANQRRQCLKMLFSFHPKNKALQRLNNGLFNCSVDYYWRFQQHLSCNKKVECEDGQDETAHCPFSRPACQGLVASTHKCYRLFSRSGAEGMNYLTAMSICRTLGLRLLSIKTIQVLRDLYKLYCGRNTDGFELEDYVKVMTGLVLAVELNAACFT